ncbi:hypothetical protein HanHA89_Chr17g0702501 [Helianthus annuus]|nr:hypothetical protein HanHA89_Chr17g0702501 [Helianthus annuus]
MVACWILWKTRNNIIFYNGALKLDDIIRDIKAYHFLWIRNRAKILDLDWVDELSLISNRFMFVVCCLLFCFTLSSYLLAGRFLIKFVDKKKP